MQDSQKTKAQFIKELAELRDRLAALTDENAADTADAGDATRPERSQLQTSIQFIGDFGLVEAKGLDLSEGGIGFEIEQDIPFDMEFEIDGELHQHRARMVWMQRLADGRSRFGFQFITAPPSSLLWLYKELGDESQ